MCAMGNKGLRLLLLGMMAGTLSLVLSGNAAAQAGPVNPDDLANVLRTLDASGTDESPVLHQTSEGYLRFLGAPQGAYFYPEGASSKSVDAADIALGFVEDHAGAFGLDGDTPELSVQSTSTHNGQHYIRMEQSYQGYPVFGAGTVVQTNADGQVLNVLTDVMRDRNSLDAKGTLTADLSLNEAIDAAKANVASRYANVTVGHLDSEVTPSLKIYHPEVLSLAGSTRLVYHTEIATDSPVHIHDVVLVDANTGEIALHYPLCHDLLQRVIWDANNSTSIPTDPVRSDIPEEIGEPANNGATGIPDVDNTYDYLGDFYDFFEAEHTWLSYDNLNDEGSPLLAAVRYPFENAVWLGDAMILGTGWATDDIVAHEAVHGVTQNTSDLIYFGFSGAINESFSDIWGEFIDLENGVGNDTADARWFLGEDIDGDYSFLVVGETDVEIPEGAIRYMRDPTLYGDPDRLGSPLLADVNSFFDNGGVHINSGIGNKLAYLLTDGDTFNNETVYGMGISTVADLFFGTQQILSPAADYHDLYFALGSSANTLELSFADRMNIAAACRAVEIVPDSVLDTQNQAKHFRATPTLDDTDTPVIVLTWVNPPPEDLNEIYIIRSVSGYPGGLGDGQLIYQGTDEAALDTDVIPGVTYYYTLFADTVETLPIFLFARATAGDTASPTWTESFSSGDALLDLDGTQILYTPVGPAQGGLGESFLGGYADYEVTIQTGIGSIPVPRNDAKADSYLVPFTNDGLIPIGLGNQVFPFFGEKHSFFYLSANGYICFEPITPSDNLNFPSISSHFEVPRISALFADLAPNISGEIWIRPLDDRLAITWDGIPEFPLFAGDSALPNLIQLELFYSGHIRVTYPQLASFSGEEINAIVGISDGRGVPVDPAEVFAGLDSVEYLVDFTDMLPDNELLHFLPIEGPIIEAGELATFTAEAVTDSGNTPVLYAEWDGPGPVPFGDNGNGTGTFFWQTGPLDAGIYTVRVKAQDGAERAYQDVRIIVGQAILLPEARNLSLSTGTPFEDPTISRPVALSSPLIAEYDYYHPQLSQDPDLYGEGSSLLYWFKNRQVVSTLTNTMIVPPSFTAAKDTWQFRVLPISNQFTLGAEAVSPIVTVLDLPVIESIVPDFGSVEGGETVRILGSRLNGPLSVTFNHVSVTSRRVISDNELEVVVPRHTAGYVDVAVTTANGTGIAYGAYRYMPEDLLDLPEDINNDGKVNALDVELVVKAVLGDKRVKNTFGTDINGDGSTDALDVQAVVNQALYL